MINKEIIISKQTREITNGDLFKLGVDGENLQENIVFKFEGEFVNGTARVEITMQDGTKSYIMTTKQDETYILPIKSIITKKGLNTMQLVITQGTDDEEIPIFKSKTFSFYIDESINAESEAPEEYPQWIDEANTKLNELDNIDIDVEKVNHTATITITKKDGTEEIVNIYDGEKGEQGEQGIQGIQGPAGQNGTNGKDGKDGKDGINGTNGQDGYSPIANVSKNGNVATISITDKNGTTTASVSDGTNGQNGQDGYSPSASVSQSGDITTITITDKSGTTSASIDLSNVGGGLECKGALPNTSSSNPFDFDDKTNLGIYTFDNKTYTYNYFYYKQNSNTTKNLTYTRLLFLIFYNVVSDVSSDEIFADMYYIGNEGGILITRFFKLQNGDVSKETIDTSQKVVSNSSQQFTGVKIFGDIPKVNSYIAPTQDVELTAKKYVDDSISTALGTIETTLGGI